MDWSFWDREICPMAEHEDSEKEMLWREANGFVFTYTRLIVHESDFRIAHEMGYYPLKLPGLNGLLSALTWPLHLNP
jgi:hypothetical protein